MTTAPPVILVGASGWLGSRLAGALPGHTPVSARAVLATRGSNVAPLLSGAGVIVVNAAGLKRGDPEALRQANARLVAVLVDALGSGGGHLVHIGSAAEYGLSQPGGLCVESAACSPDSEYGRSKLEGTEIALSAGRATVLRVFNILASPPQPDSPLADIVGRTAAGIAEHRDVELLSAGTVRDWTTVEFVRESVACAAQQRPQGVFNVCSGRPVVMGDAVERVLSSRREGIRVLDLGRFPATTVIGSPDAWATASGLRAETDTDSLAQVIAGSLPPGREADDGGGDGS